MSQSAPKATESAQAQWPVLVIGFGGVLTAGWIALLGYGVLALVHAI